MQAIELVRAKRGAKKVSCTAALQAQCGFGLSAAKATTDALLEGKRPQVTMQSGEAAREFILTLAQLGVVARFAEGPNYDPQERLSSALGQLRLVLTPETMRTCESLNAHGESEEALFHCLASVSSHLEAIPFSAREALTLLAIEFGVAWKREP
jgi:hypothetical protein